jgi:hypothetical protein
MKKIISSIVIVILLLGTLIAPCLNAEIYKKTNEKKPLGKVKEVSFEVIEFKSDGTKEIKIVEMTIQESKELKNKLKEISTSDEKLSLYKEYGLIPEDVTLEKLKKGMNERAESIGLSEEKLSQISEKNFNILTDFDFFGINSRCSVIGSNGCPLRLIFGLSTITRVINCYLLFYSYFLNFLNLNIIVPSIDLINSHLGFIISFQALNGLHPDINLDGLSIFGILGMIGFVGFYVHASDYWPFFLLPVLTFMDAFFGYSALVLVAGNEFNPYRWELNMNLGR